MAANPPLDLRKLIEGPFISCPKCGNGHFGIISAGPDRFNRQCRDCSYRNSSSLPNITKTIIYLDQFAISDLVHVRDNSKTLLPFWHKLYKKLAHLSALQLIVCPKSVAHMLESVIASRSSQFQAGAEIFAHEVFFTDFESIRHSTVLKALDAWMKGPDTSMPKVELSEIIHGNPHAWDGRWRFAAMMPPIPGYAEAIRVDRDASHAGLLDVFSNKWKKSPHRSWDSWYEEESCAYGRELIKRYNTERQKWADVQSGKRKLANLFEALPEPVLRVIATICHKLEHSGITKDDIPREAERFITSTFLRSAPFIRISSSIYASLAMKAPSQQKLPTPGFFSDGDVISCLLPCCDAMLLDREICAFWRETQSSPKHRLPYATQVFSTAYQDQFISYLDGIEAAVTPEHRERIREVYDYPPAHI